MKITKGFGAKALILMMVSMLTIGAGTLPAEADEPGPFQRLFRAITHGSQHKSTTHRSSHKQSSAVADTSSSSAETTASPGSSGGAGVSNPPNSKNTRGASKATTKKGDDMPYGTPVPGKQGFVTSPFSPNSGYIDVRGFAPGTPVKDPYTGKVFLTP